MMRYLFAGLTALCLFGSPALASQGTCIMPTVGTVTGLTLVNDINVCNSALLSLYSGASAPTSPTTGMLWYNTSTNYVQQYDGTSWQNLWFVDATNHLQTRAIGGGIVSQTITSVGGAPDLGSVPQSYKTISGTTTVTSLGSSAGLGSVHIVAFSGILTLTNNNTSLILPGGANITTAAGDTMVAIYLGGSNWRVLMYTPISGTNVKSIAGNTGIFTLGPGFTNSTNILQSDPLYKRGYLSGLTLSAAGGTATFGVATGVAVDDAVTSLMLLPSAYTKTTSAWTLGSAGGCLDTGTIAINTWYHEFEIKRLDTGVVDIACSITVAGPTFGVNIPAAYTVSRRIGSMKTDGSSQWVAFTQVGDKFIWAAPIQDVSAIAPTTARVVKALSVPTGIVVNALFRGAVTPAGATTTAVMFPALIETDVATTTNNADISAFNGNGNAPIERLTNTSAQIGVRSSSTSGIYSISTYGWIDTRGK
jgi:hypothetical protein